MKYAPSNITEDVAVRLVLKHPFWAELYYSFNIHEMPAGFNAPYPDTLATDERSMWVSPGFWSQLPLGLQISAVAHEIVHKMLHHCTRRGTRDPLLWQGCCDEVVNEMLVDNHMPIGKNWVQPVPARHGWSVDARYNEAARQYTPKPEKNGSQYSESGVPQSWLDAWQDIKEVKGTPEQIAKHEELVEATVQKALHQAKAMGYLPAGVEMQLDHAYAPAEEPWYNHLHRFMLELCVSQYDWNRVNKRYLCVHGIVAPSNYTEALGPVVVFRDVSGSMYVHAVQEQLMTHVDAIMAQAKPSRLVLADFDVGIRQVAEFDRGDDDIKLRPKGGGGTSFVELFEWLDQQDIQPAAVIVLTDMYGTFPSADPGYPVIWAATTDVKAPFGETIHVN